MTDERTDIGECRVAFATENADLYHCIYEGCNHSTISKDDLTRHHQRIHQKIKRRQCDLCTFTGFTNGDLKEHQDQVHFQIKPNKCQMCNFACYKNTNLKAHLKHVHKIEI